jgi:3-hydroxyethyl bacteriochlorophyllide a dehydrogenase
MRYTQAIVIPEPNRVELREVALIEPGPDDVIVQTAYTSISAGTERMLLTGRMPHPMLQFPVVPGYETVGRIVGLGANVPQEYEGRWVYVGGARCYDGVNPAWGGQSQTLFADYRKVVPLDTIPPEQGVLLALAATALHGIDLIATEGTETTEGKSVVSTSLPSANSVAQTKKRALVLGQGPVGQIAARLLRGRGRWVTVTDRYAARLERSVADEVIDRNESNGPLSNFLSPQQPFDAIVEATGSMAALAEALPLLSDGGAILLLGYYDELRLPYMPLFLKQARLLTAREWGPGDLAECRDMLADGSLDLAGLITHRLPVEQVEEAYRVALNEPECLKLVLEWEIGD